MIRMTIWENVGMAFFGHPHHQQQHDDDDYWYSAHWYSAHWDEFDDAIRNLFLPPKYDTSLTKSRSAPLWDSLRVRRYLHYGGTGAEVIHTPPLSTTPRITNAVSADGKQRAWLRASTSTAANAAAASSSFLDESADAQTFSLKSSLREHHHPVGASGTTKNPYKNTTDRMMQLCGNEEEKKSTTSRSSANRTASDLSKDTDEHELNNLLLQRFSKRNLFSYQQRPSEMQLEVRSGGGGGEEDGHDNDPMVVPAEIYVDVSASVLHGFDHDDEWLSLRCQ